MAERQVIAGLPLFPAAVAAPAPRFETGSAFWRAVEALAPDDRLAGQLDQLLAGAPAPRTWLLLHEPDQAHLSAVAALMLARALLSRGQNVLVLDVDEQGAALTIWAEREETEGWIDVARFGASVLSAGITLPFRGGRGTLLGIGSFVPTDVTEDEIISLLGRLRHQADDIVLVAAVGPAALPWARRAERRLYCWDRGARATGQLGKVTGPFAAEGVPLTGLVGYGEAAVAAPQGAPAAPDAVPSAARAAAPTAVAEPAPEPVAMEPPAAARSKQAAAPAVTEQPAPDRTSGPAGTDAEIEALVDSALEEEPDGARTTPRLFWVAAAVFGVALVAIAWYWSNYIRVPPGGYFEPVVTQPAEAAPRDTLRSTPVLGTDPAAASAPATGDAVDQAPGTAEPERRVAEAGGLSSAGDTLARAAGGQSTAAPGPDPQAPGPGAAPRPAGGFDRAPYAVPVGQSGWALHVYSLPDSAGAAQQVAGLERAGFRTAVRIVEIKEKGGRWWRIYVGSFASRQAAAAALPALLDRLQADWAEPARIQVTNP